MRNSSNFTTYVFADLLSWLYWCHLSIRRSLNDGGTCLPFSSSFIISHVSIGHWSQDACMFSKLVQYWLAWPVSFMAANLIFLGSVRLYHVKYLSSWSVHSRKSCGLWRPSKMGTWILMFFRYWSSGLGGLSVLSRRLLRDEEEFSPMEDSHSIFLLLAL